MQYRNDEQLNEYQTGIRGEEWMNSPDVLKKCEHVFLTEDLINNN